MPERRPSAIAGHVDRWLAQVENDYRERTPASRRLHARARGSLPGGDTRSFAHHRPYPLYLSIGEGTTIRDADGNAYLDLGNNASTLVHGHAHPDIVAAIGHQAARGTSWTARSELEIIWAEKLCARTDSLERVRFTNSGTEAVMFMVRVARAATGRNLVLKTDLAFHGSYDGTMPEPSSPRESDGLAPALRRTLLSAPFNDADRVCSLIVEQAADLAAVLLSPVWSGGGLRGLGYIEPAAGFLEEVRRVTAAHGVLLLFDEVITYRLALGGAQNLFGVVPDLTAAGKLIGGGLPVGTFGGRAELMALTSPEEGARVPHSGTFSGNPLTAAAGIAALDLLTADAIAGIDALGASLRDGLTELAARHQLPVEVTGVGSLVQVQPSRDDPVYGGFTDSEFVAVTNGLRLGLLNQGVAGFPFFAVSTVMDETHVDRTLLACDEVFAQCAAALRG